MNLTANDAAEALQTADAAGQRMNLLRRYSAFAPFMLLWGTIWLACGVTTDLQPAWSNTAWLAGSLIGFAASLGIAIHNIRTRAHRTADSSGAARTPALRFIAIWLAVFGFFWAAFHILGPVTGRQSNAFISLTIAFLYALYGAWAGWRIFAVGVATATAVLFGYTALQDHYFMWMGLVSGGALILGGLWLRKA